MLKKSLLIAIGWLTLASVAYAENYALNFDGTDDYVELPYNASLYIGSGNFFTIEAWVKRSAIGTRHNILERNSGGKIITLYVHSDNKVYGTTYADGVNNTGVVSASTVGTDWTHIAFVRSGTAHTLYINGVSDGSTTGDIRDVGVNASLYIGRLPGGGENFNGKMDEIRIWDTARTEAEIKANMYNEIGTHANLKAYYKMSDGSGASLADNSGNGNTGTINGTINGGATWVPSFYTITYDGNSNTGGTAPDTQIKTHGVDLTLATNSGSLERTGHTFAGWTDGLGTDYAAGAIYTANAPLTLYAKWTTNSYTLTVSKSGTGSGSITSSPAGIDCDSDCTESITQGTVVTLTATADSGSTFTGWSGGGCAGNGSCSVTMNSDTTVTANFGTSTTNRGYALSFDGNDYVEIADNDQLDLTSPSSYTIEAWIKPKSFKWLGGIVGKYHTSGANGYSLRLSAISSSDATIPSYSGINFDEMSTANGILTLDQWQHIAAVNNNGIRELYVNGINKTLSSGSPTTIANNDDPLVIGADYQIAGARYFDGLIDEVRIWNVARTQSEIQTNKDIELTGSESGLLVYYNFNQGVPSSNNSGLQTIYDKTSGHKDGTLKNFALNGESSNWVMVTPNTYTVTYNANGGTGTLPTDSNSPYTQGATVTVLGNTGTLAKSGCTFAGWNTQADGSGTTTYQANNTFVMGTASITLYAKWITPPHPPTDITFNPPITIAPGNYLVNNLGGTNGFGTLSSVTNDDDNCQRVPVSAVFTNGFNFFGNIYDAATEFYIGTNGYITFGSGNTSFSALGIAGYTSPLIAGQFDDIQLGGIGYKSDEGGNSKGSNDLYYNIDDINHVVTITWDDINPFSGPTYGSVINGGNAFQIRLHDLGSGDFAIEIRYEAINWACGNGDKYPTAGWTAGNLINYGEVTGSGTAGFLDAASASNIGHPGVFVWFVLGGQVPGLLMENAAAGTLVGSLFAVDADFPADSHTFILTDNDGGRFEITNDNKLKVASNAPSDASGRIFYYETATTRSVKVRCTDSASNTYDKTLTINVVDVVKSPTVTTGTVGVVIDNGNITANVNGNITAIGGENANTRGFCWSTSVDPTINDSKTTDTGSFGIGAFTGNITGLSLGTTYHVRAYATNSEGTAYGVDTILPPLPPTGVTATAGNQSAIVSWTASSGATSYQVTGSGSPSGSCTATAATTCTVNGLANDTPYTFTVTATVTASNGSATSVASIPSNSVTPSNITYTVTLNARAWAGSGSVDTQAVNNTNSPLTLTKTINQNQTTTFSIIPDTGSTATVTGCRGGALSGTSPNYTYTTGPITADCPVTATFIQKSYTVTGNAPGAGSGGTITPFTRTIQHGGTATFTITPDWGYEIDSVTSGAGCSGTRSGNIYNITIGNDITDNCTVTATFKKRQYEVRGIATGNGSISATQSVDHGSTATFTVTPSPGYSINYVLGCGGGTLSGNTYTTGPITGPCKVIAFFR